MQMSSPCQEHYSRKGNIVSFQIQNLKGSRRFKEMWAVVAK